MKYVSRVTQVTVQPEGKPLYDATSTIIDIDDEGGVEFVEITQYPEDKDEQSIRVAPEDWPMIRKAVDDLIKQCKE